MILSAFSKACGPRKGRRRLPPAKAAQAQAAPAVAPAPADPKTSKA
jgi:hypothetical protein